MDIRPDQWSFEARRAFFRATGTNPAFARKRLERIVDEIILAQSEGRADATDALLNIDPDWLVGFAWIAERDRDGRITFEDVLVQADEDALLERLVELVSAELEEKAAAKAAAKAASPLPAGSEPSCEPTPPSNPTSETASPSSPTSAAE